MTTSGPMTTSDRAYLFCLATAAQGYADALIDIAAAFTAAGPDPEIVTVDGTRRAVPNACAWCRTLFHAVCQADCAGLIARRALGISD